MLVLEFENKNDGGLEIIINQNISLHSERTKAEQEVQFGPLLLLIYIRGLGKQTYFVSLCHMHLSMYMN